MRSSSLNKVCFPIGGEPAIRKTVSALCNSGIKHNFIVVGHLSEQVMDALASSQAKNYFCYQPKPLGTGNAAKEAAKLIEDFNGPDAVLVTAGDKIIDENILKGLIDYFYRKDADLCFLSGKRKDFPEAGIIVAGENGRAAGIVEGADAARAELLIKLKEQLAVAPLPAEDAGALAVGLLKTEKKACAALGALWERIKKGKNITEKTFHNHFSAEDFFIRAGNLRLSPGDLNKYDACNLSVYLFKKKAFLSSVKNLGSDNAQGEEYLTDAVSFLSRNKADVAHLPVENPSLVMAYNTPEDLCRIEKHLSAAHPAFVIEKKTHSRPPLQWLRHFETSSRESEKYFESVYGKNYPFSDKKRRGVIKALLQYKNRFGDAPCIISRAPGRVNVMGRHIDHQGGDVNMIAIDRDIYCVMGERADSRVVAHNLDAYRFPEREFCIEELHADSRMNWDELLSDARFKKQVSVDKGDWVQYVKAVFTRLRHGYPGIRLKGANMTFEGDIPAGGGVSSSSALFVAVAEGAVSVNSLKIPPGKFVGMCGEGEWYVGTRGGSADHGAIKFSRKGRITQLEFFPFKKIRSYPFPEGCSLAVCNSGRKAHKTKGVKDIFNQRVACYHAGLDLLKQKFSALKDVSYLRDISSGAFSAPEIFRMVKALPVRIESGELAGMLSSEDVKARIASISKNAGSMELRAAVLFGICECARGRYAHELLEAGDIEAFGRLMNISHDGDRVLSRGGLENPVPFTSDYSDKRIDALIKKAGAGRRLIIEEPGSYSCSTPEIDRMVDIAVSSPGVFGAQISGAGLGGCMMALLREEDYFSLEENLTRGYYEISHMDVDMFAASPVSGSGLVRF